MSNLVAIRRRIKSAKNIAQITKAMEMVSGSKMKRAQESALLARPFSHKLEEIISHIAAGANSQTHPLLRNSLHPKNAMLIIVSTNKGLCGSLNVNLFRKISDWAAKESGHDQLHIVHVHKKARTLLPPGRKHQLVALFHELGEKPSFEESRSISKLAITSFERGEVDEVFIAYPRFVSTLENIPTIKRLLPIPLPPSETTSLTTEHLFEPSSSSLLATLLPYEVEMSIYQILIEASASEHSARMVAMKSASDNAHDLIGGLTLDYNQARQSAVTTELLDATTARMALKN